jgi:excisionase family DNA binding protein
MDKSRRGGKFRSSKGVALPVSVGTGIQMKRKGGARTRRDETRAPRVMTVREVAAYLSVHPSTIYRLLKHNQIPAFHIGGSWRFNIETIDHWRRQQEKTGN